jgi:hypothetical protein
MRRLFILNEIGRGHILDDQPCCGCCEQSNCRNDECQKDSQSMRPFLSDSVSRSKRNREGCNALLMVKNGKEQTNEDRSPKR